MKKILAIIICYLFTLSINSQEIKINSEKSIVEFNYVEEEAIGTINGINGKITFDISNLSASSFEAKVNIASINTSNKTRDSHLNASDYFHTEKYPEILFKSNNVSISENKYILKGTLTIKDVSKKEAISFVYKDGVFNGKCVIYSNDYNIHERKVREDSKILIKITVPTL
jgi:polyisoprenoid-binding protein YceI